MGRVREKSRLFDELAWNCRWMRTLLCRIVRIVSIKVVTANLFQLDGVLHVDAVCMIHSVLLTGCTGTVGTVPVTFFTPRLEQT